MEDVLYYLLKVSAATTVFYFAYYLLLRRNKDFVFNRFYLLGSFLLSFIIPLATFKTSSYLSQANVYFREGIGAEALEPVGDPSLAETPIGWPEILLALYRSEEQTSELQSRPHLVCRPLLEKKKHSTRVQ